MPHASVAIIRVSALVASLTAIGVTPFVVSACGGDEGKTCVASLCDPGEAAVCSGNDVRKCVGGTSYSYTPCGAQQRCDASGGAAVCVARQCTNLGVASCATPTSVVKCLDDGSGTETTNCSGGERCNDGACVAQACTGTDAVCTANGFLTCSNGNWTSTGCGAGKVCTLTSGAAQCTDPVCTPGGFRCEGNSARECDARGTNEIGTTCAKGDICVAGRCQAEVCGVDQPDATTGDTSGGDADTSAPSSQISIKIGTATTVFDQSAYAEFDSGPKTLTLRAEKSSKAIRIILENTRAAVTGPFSDAVFSTTHVTICYDDGGPAQTFDRCPEGFTHQSTLYNVNVGQNDGQGGRVVGTFETTVNDENGDPTAIVDGQFSLNYR